MKVTTLIENRPSKTDPHLAYEWGLSFYIEFSGHRILFDTGASGSFAENAEHLSVNVASVEAAVLSHHHFDHGGGLRRFFELNTAAKVYLGESPDGDCFHRTLGFFKKYVGLDKALVTEFADRFKTVSQPLQMLPDVYVIPHIDGNHPRPDGNKHIYLRKGGSLTSDDFNHEVVMAIEENGKLVVFTGCSHNGILNAIEKAGQEFPGIPIKAVFGGFHLVSVLPFLMAGSKRQVEDIGKVILNYPIETTYTGHCTGTKAFGVLKTVMGEHIVDIRTGSCFEV